MRQPKFESEDSNPKQSPNPKSYHTQFLDFGFGDCFGFVSSDFGFIFRARFSTSRRWSCTPKWPTGREANGNEGVAALVKELGGSIGYVEFIYALRKHLSYGRVRNRSGEFVEASLESIAAAVGHPTEIRDDFKVSIVDAPGDGAYPIASFTWIVVPSHIGDREKRTAIAQFLRWMLGPGQRQAAALGYLALPREFVVKEEEAVGRIH